MFGSVQAHHVYLRAEFKKFETLSGEAMRAKLDRVFVFNGLLLFRSRDPLDCSVTRQGAKFYLLNVTEGFSIDLPPGHSQDIPYCGPRDSLILVGVSLLSLGVGGRLALPDRFPPGISWNLLI